MSSPMSSPRFGESSYATVLSIQGMTCSQVGKVKSRGRVMGLSSDGRLIAIVEEFPDRIDALKCGTLQKGERLDTSAGVLIVE